MDNNSYRWQAAGFSLDNDCMAINCYSNNNLGSNTNGFYSYQTNIVFIDCISDTNGQHGFYADDAEALTMTGCTTYNNTLDGVNLNYHDFVGFAYLENCKLIKNGRWGINNAGTVMASGIISNCGFGVGSDTNINGDINEVSPTLELLNNFSCPSPAQRFGCHCADNYDHHLRCNFR